ncbi:hypothetical protein C8Q70DRAFT_1056669 [Cubamyces menziesii]|nr:hypothetical protein C8Q70DRAFT_1056669 [Cubamyces menziesii]
MAQRAFSTSISSMKSFNDTVTATCYDTCPDAEAERRRNLASAARVCKAFHEPALRVLWRQLESLLPFFSLIGPPFAMVQKEAETYCLRPARDVYHLPDHVSAQGWARLRKYAAYVRILYLWRWPVHMPYVLTPESWTSMEVLFGDQPIFPNLRNLLWGAGHPEAELLGILRFLPPTVDKLFLSCYTSPRPDEELGPVWRALLPRVVEDICKRVTRLSHFSVYLGDIDGSELLTVLSLSHPPTLRGLNLRTQYGAPPITFSSFMGLARIIDLENLILCVECDSDSAASLPSLLGLPRLRHLRIPCYSELSSPAYGVITAARLQSLNVHSMPYSSIAYLQRTCATWACSFPNLEVLNFELSPSTPQDGVPTRSLLTAARALLDLRNIRTFVLHAQGCPLTVEDVDLTAMSEAWPSLTELCLGTMSTPDYSSGSTAGASGLLSLAINCPRLTTLKFNQIVLRTEDDSVWPEEPLNHPLKKLEVTRGIAPNVCHLHDKLFPCLNLQGEPAEDGLYYVLVRQTVINTRIRALTPS